MRVQDVGGKQSKTMRCYMLRLVVSIMLQPRTPRVYAKNRCGLACRRVASSFEMPLRPSNLPGGSFLKWFLFCGFRFEKKLFGEIQSRLEKVNCEYPPRQICVPLACPEHAVYSDSAQTFQILSVNSDQSVTNERRITGQTKIQPRVQDER